MDNKSLHFVVLTVDEASTGWCQLASSHQVVKGKVFVGLCEIHVFFTCFQLEKAE